MKRKVKRYNKEGLVEDDDINRAVAAAQKPDVEKLKEGIVSNYTPTTDIEEGSRPGKNLAFLPDVTPRPKPKPKPKPRTASQTFPVDANMERGSDVLKRGQASTDGSGVSPLDKYKRDKEATATREKRKMDAAIERAKAGVPERRSGVDIAAERLGMKKGGSVGSASKRADGCAQRGKTRGKMY
jgi:hypothetical protein